VAGKVEYAHRPSTNGDHAPLWQNCGFYEKRIQDENAVHSLSDEQTDSSWTGFRVTKTAPLSGNGCTGARRSTSPR
jgi:hypothetical protein